MLVCFELKRLQVRDHRWNPLISPGELMGSNDAPYF